MSIKDALNFKPKLKLLRHRKAVFIVVPVRWLWLQIGAAVLFLAGAVWAGFWFGGGELDKRAKEAVAAYFEELQGGMTQAELERRIAMIREGSDTLTGSQPLGQLHALTSQITVAGDKTTIAGFVEIDRATGRMTIRSVDSAPGYVIIRVPREEAWFGRPYSGGLIELAEGDRAMNIRLRIGVLAESRRGFVMSADRNTNNENPPKVWP